MHNSCFNMVASPVQTPGVTNEGFGMVCVWHLTEEVSGGSAEVRGRVGTMASPLKLTPKPQLSKYHFIGRTSIIGEATTYAIKERMNTSGENGVGMSSISCGLYFYTRTWHLIMFKIFS